MTEPTSTCDHQEAEYAGGFRVVNRKGQIILWWKVKFRKGEEPFALCVYRPELADSEEERRKVVDIFEDKRRRWRFSLYDMLDVTAEITTYLAETGPKMEGLRQKASRPESVTVYVTDLSTGQKEGLTLDVSGSETTHQRRSASDLNKEAEQLASYSPKKPLCEMNLEEVEAEARRIQDMDSLDKGKCLESIKVKSTADLINRVESFSSVTSIHECVVIVLSELELRRRRLLQKHLSPLERKFWRWHSEMIRNANAHSSTRHATHETAMQG
jgi:hypothetical protein